MAPAALWYPELAGTPASIWKPGGAESIPGYSCSLGPMTIADLTGVTFGDNFTEADGTDITTHSPDTGGLAWSGTSATTFINNGAVDLVSYDMLQVNNLIEIDTINTVYRVGFSCKQEADAYAQIIFSHTASLPITTLTIQPIAGITLVTAESWYADATTPHGVIGDLANCAWHELVLSFSSDVMFSIDGSTPVVTTFTSGDTSGEPSGRCSVSGDGISISHITVGNPLG